MTPTWVQEKLEDAGIIVVRFDCFKPETYVEEADKLGYIFGKRDEVDNFIEFYEGCLNSIKEKVEEIPEDEKTKIYIERFRTPYSTSGKGVALHQIIELAGGNNIFSDLSGHINVDPEEVIIRNPIIIVKQAYARTEYGYNVDDTKGLKDVRDEIMGRPELGDVSAVKNKKVYVVIKEITGGKHFIAIGYMAKWFYPDLDPEAIHQEYLTRFQGLDFDLDEHGVFVYPPLED
jgi:iron complex transport system substrate-binding protein